jgi:hypothetical protein
MLIPYNCIVLPYINSVIQINVCEEDCLIERKSAGWIFYREMRSSSLPLIKVHISPKGESQEIKGTKAEAVIEDSGLGVRDNLLQILDLRLQNDINGE